jgi:transposase
LSRAAQFWALSQIVLDHCSISSIAQVLQVSWDTVNTAVFELGNELLINDPHRLDGVQAIGVDEHVWRHTRKGDKYVTVIIDFTGVLQRTGSARLLEMVPGRSAKAFQDWLAAQTQQFRDQIEIVSMDGFTGYKTAAQTELPDAVEVMDPFHVVKLAGDALDKTRQRIQRETLGHRGRKHDPLYASRRALRTGVELLSVKQEQKITELFTDPAHAPVEACWGVYQEMIACYRDKKPEAGKKRMRTLINKISSKIPAGLEEIQTLGRTLKKRATDILAYFDHPHSSNGPTEAINGRLDHLRGTALGFRNLFNYRIRSLLETGGFRPKIHSLS